MQSNFNYLLLMMMATTSLVAGIVENGVVYSDFNLSMPRFRFQMWEDVEPELKELATLMGYTNASWEILRTNGIETLTFYDFQDMKNINKDYKDYVTAVDKSVKNGTAVLETMGFDEDSFDCWMSHWSWYSWSELEFYEINYTFVDLGWNEEKWSSENQSVWPISTFTAWANLTDVEQQAAANLCYLNWTWDGYWFEEFVAESTYINSVEPWLSSTPAPTPAPAPTGGGMGFCFPGSARVTVLLEDNKGLTSNKKMEDLRLGDKIMVQDGTYETVYSFGHYDKDIRSDVFVTITTSNGKSVTLTPNHMIMTANRGTIAASSVRPADSLITSSTTQEELIVTRITKNVMKKGMYAPFTNSGYLVVDDIVVSNYIAVDTTAPVILGGLVSHQWIAHAFNAPHRFYCRIKDCTTETYTEEGLSAWIATPMSVAQWITMESNNNSIIKTIGSIIFVVVGIVFNIMFEENSQQQALIVAAAVLGMMVFAVMTHNNKKKVSM